ncbi:MAG: glycosyltransferase family 2 protein [Candidatus Sericytochromatia bacterium]
MEKLEIEENNTISLCMLVKNNEKNVKRALDSLQGIIDELIIVDLGSTDKTIEIVKPYGSKIFQYEWNGSYADARNFALEQATCDWIFIMNPDEILEEVTKNLLYDAIQYEKGIANFIFITHILNGQTLQTPELRVFRNKKNIKFKGIVNENVYEDVKDLYLNKKREYRIFPVYVTDYSNQEEDYKTKIKEKLELTNKAFELETNPLDKLRHLLKKIEYLKLLEENHNDIPKYLQEGFQIAAKIKDPLIFNFDDPIKDLNMEIVESLILLGNYQRALLMVEYALKMYPNSFNALMAKLNCLKFLDKKEEFDETLEKLKEFTKNNTYNPYETTIFELMRNMTISFNQQQAEEQKATESSYDDAPSIIAIDDFIID